MDDLSAYLRELMILAALDAYQADEVVASVVSWTTWSDDRHQTGQARIVCRTHPRLQWGRVTEDAERMEDPSRPPEVVEPLQWGRVTEDAERMKRTKDTIHAAVVLQWGRVTEDAES